MCQPPHVVKRELVRARAVAHLGQTRVLIVGIIHGRALRIELLCQPVQLVVSVGDLLVLSVSFAGQIVVRVVPIGFDIARGESRPRDPAKRIIGERGRVVVSILDARQVAFRVIAVRGDVVGSGRVGDAGQPVRIVIRVSGRLAI